MAYMRQPKLYIRLPSQGKYWRPGSLDISPTGEYAVYSMTARDELLLKIPDALMNGQAVVDVIQNCMPNVRDAWNTPNIDLDVILIAIRIATYGEMMDTPLRIGDLDLEYAMDLRIVMDSLQNSISWDPVVPINDEITVFVRPYTYRDVTRTANDAFETERIIQLVDNKEMDQDQKIQAFQTSFRNLTSSMVNTMASCISRVDTSNGSVDNPEFIQEFINNMDKGMFSRIQDHLDALKLQNSIKPIQVSVTDDMRAAGVTGDTVEVPITFDPSTFFV
jgi:hypothetical protein